MKRSILVFFLFTVVALVLYFPTAGAGFVTDQIGWFEQYNLYGWKGLSSAFGDRSAHFVYHLFGFTMWKLFGMNDYAWMSVFVLLHALTATLAFHLFAIVFKKVIPERAEDVALAGAFLFLINPYQTEVLVWYACIHYLVCSALCLTALTQFIRYAETGENRYAVVFYAFFIPAVFTLEISFSLPLIVTLFIMFLPAAENIYKSRRWLFILFVLPSVLVVVFYFLINKLLRGNFAGHYGAATHFNFDIALLAANFAKYSAKVFALAQFWPYEWREPLYQFFAGKGFVLGLAGMFVFVGVTAWLYKRGSTGVKTVYVLFVTFALALAPILNLFFYYIGNVEGDRFSYFATVFAMQLVAFLCVRLLRATGWVALVLFAVAQLYFLRVNAISWKENNEVRQSLLTTFNAATAPQIYLLNAPDNYRGTYMFRTFLPDNSFAGTHALLYGSNFENQVTQVLSYNMNSLADSVVVEKISDNELKVTFAQWGNWWWQGGVGANSYSTDKYEVTIDEWSHAYNIRFKGKTAGAVYLYQCGKQWRKVEGF